MVALWPIQRVAYSGSTRNCQTVSGVASIAISRTTDVVSVALAMLLPLLSLGLALERVEAVAPEIVEKRLQLGEALRPRAVEASRAVASFVHEPGLLQDLQVLGDRRLRHVEVRRDLVWDAELTAGAIASHVDV